MVTRGRKCMGSQQRHVESREGLVPNPYVSLELRRSERRICSGGWRPRTRQNFLLCIFPKQKKEGIAEPGREQSQPVLSVTKKRRRRWKTSQTRSPGTRNFLGAIE